jgi:nicotinate-nucleotide pyrophosphorylase
MADGILDSALFMAHQDFDLIILDVMMPEYDGWAVCREIRKSSQVPIIMLTARGEESDELFGFDLGADEYIAKPFSLKILAARVQALLRRTETNKEVISYDGLELDKPGRQVYLDSKEIELSPKEFDLLLYLAENEGIALSREQILNAVWDYDYFGDGRTIDTHIKKLRSKLGDKNELIQTVRGLGYRFEVGKMLPSWYIDEAVRRALAEDVGKGDLTTNALVPENLRAEGLIYSKAHGILAGMPAAKRTFRCLDPEVRFEQEMADGSELAPGSVIAQIKGQGRALLTGERVALNFLQRLSGVATATRELLKIVEGTKAQLVDTRKTTPGLRLLEKYAVRAGGGYNHRLGLDDGVLIKDNHIKVAGGITEAIRRARAVTPHTIKIEVEVESIDQLNEALEAGAEIIMLDNMSFDMMREAVNITAGRVPLEASGGISGDTIRKVAETGVDLISVGAVTHSATALDISMDIGEMKEFLLV